MRILITGGAGFIGSHLAEYYLKEGHEVYVIDDLSTGSIENIRPFEHENGFHMITDSVLNESRILELVGICDRVIHLAAAVGVKYILDNPLKSIDTNIKGTELLLRYASKFRKRILVASTSEVYGKHMHAPLVETDNLIYGPPTTWRWSYAASKLIDEYTALAYFRNKNLEVIITRFFNTIGPRQTGRYGMVVPRFIGQATQGKQITVYGDGEQTRTFTYVGDVCRCVASLMEAESSIGQVVNIGGDEEISINQLASMIKVLTNSSSEIVHLAYEEVFEKDFEDMKRRVPSLEKLRQLIGFKPETSLEETLKKIIKFGVSF